MKTNQDNPVDSLGNLGAPIRPTVTKPDPVKEFEQQSDRISNAQKAVDDFYEAMRKEIEQIRKGIDYFITDGQQDDWKDIV